MTQQLQDEFDSSVENAEAWMKAIQERLRINDNTKGPRSALEARLRETEKMHGLVPEGSLKMDMVLAKANAALRSITQDKKCEVLSKLKDIKDLWEETTVYITHCHSRIEWVWLHWNEYLKAQDEFYAWIHNMRRTLESDIELQLGLKEKQCQLRHAQVLLNDVTNHSVLLETLLEEGASLFSRTDDPSVGEDVQKKIKADYEGIMQEAQSRVKLHEKITKEHEQYSANVNQFQSWLNGVTERLNCCTGDATRSSAEERLKAPKEIAKNIRSGRKKWKYLEKQCAEVIPNTSPLGAKRMKDELEELRKALEKLELQSSEEKRLLKMQQSESGYESQARQLQADIQELRKELQRLEDDLDPGEGEMTEDEFVTQWRKCSATVTALAAEESKIERLKAQLKELLQFSQDVQPRTRSLESAIQQYQSVKGKISKMITDTESQLRRLFQNPLQDFEHWKSSVQVLLESSEPVMAHIEAALAESSQFKEKLTTLQLKKDLLNNVLGDKNAVSFLQEVAEASKEREILHRSLLESKSKLRNLISQHKDFDAGFTPLQKKLSAIKAKLDLEKEPQPDLLGKKTQLQRLQTMQDDLAELVIQMEEAEKLIQSNTAHRNEMNQLASDSQALKRSLEMMIQQREEQVQKHWAYDDRLSDLQQWIKLATEQIDSYQGADGEEKTEGRVASLERWLAEFPDKEIQLHIVEAHGHLVMENSSPEESAHVQAELDQLEESWRSLKKKTTGLLKKWQLNRPVADKKKIAFVDNRWMSGPAFHLSDVDPNHKQEKIGEGQKKSSWLKLLRDFEEWLQGENTKLTKILAVNSSSAEEIKACYTKLEELKSHVPDGQCLFEDLLHLCPATGNSEDLEDLCYQWTLYKSKLKESMSSLSPGSLEEPDRFRKKHRGGTYSFARRVCCVALPLQLLLLLLLLVVILLQAVCAN